MKKANYFVLFLVIIVLGFVCWHMRRAALGVDRLAFSPEGRIQSRTTPNGDTIKYEYDKSGRLAKIKYPWWSSVDFRYNDASELASFQDKSGATEFRRDPFGRVAHVISQGRDLAYQYDPWGRIDTVKVSDGYEVRYERNMFGFLTAVDDGHGRLLYERHGQQMVRRLPNGIVTTFDLSPEGRILSIVHRKANGGLIGSFTYKYRADGKQTQVDEETDHSHTTKTFEYDLLGRLTSILDSARGRTDYTYDVLGNRKTATTGGQTEVYEYDKLGRLTRAGAKTFTYDNSGNVISKTDTEKGTTTKYKYDIENRLIEVRGPSKVRYIYDALGNRIGRTGQDGASYYVNDASSGFNQVVAVFGAAGKPKAYYLWGDSRIAERRTDGSTRYYLADRRGSVRFVADETGNVSEERTYLPFGRMMEETGRAGETFGFDGESWDSETGLLYLRRRYYDPDLGRFISADPYRGDISNPRSLNRYVYCSDDPVNRRDPSGLQDDGGGGFGFDAPTIDTGSSYSGSSLPQDYLDNWIQSPSTSAPSFMNTVKSAVSNILAPIQTVLDVTSSAVSKLEYPSPIVQSVERSALAGLDVAANFVPGVGETVKTITGLSGAGVSIWDAGWTPDWSSKEFKVTSANAALGTGAAVAAMIAFPPATPFAAGAALMTDSPAFVDTGARLMGATPQQITDAQYGAYSELLSGPGYPLSLLNGGIESLARSVSSAATSDISQSVASAAFNDALSAFGAGPVLGDDVQFSMADQTPVGGVRLDKAAELIGSLASIIGASFDPKSGRVTLVGDKNVSLPPMRLEDLAVALRAAYSGDPHDPSMTIDPDPRNPRGPTMNVIYFGGTANTHFGWVMFEADRRMKTYSIGRDSLSKAPVQSQIKGYFNLFQLGEANPRGYNSHLWSRFWLVPERIKLRVSSDGKAVLFDETKIRVCTETMCWAGGRLVSANPPDAAKRNPNSPCVEVSGEKDEPAEYFAKHFSEHYEDYAKENEIYSELKRLAQIYALAKWMKQAGIQIDLQWVDGVLSHSFDTPKTTPSISNGVSRTWKTGSVTHSESHFVFGGTDLGAQVAFKAGDSRADAFATSLAKIFAGNGGHSQTEVLLNGRKQVTLDFPTAPRPGYGSFRTSSLDLISPGAANVTLSLQRFYTSFHTGPTTFGRSWSFLLPRLNFVGVTKKGEIRKIAVEGHPETAVTVQSFSVTNDFGTFHQSFAEHFIDQEWKRIGFKPKPGNSRLRGLYPNKDGSFSLMFTDGDEWRFDGSGNLIALHSGGTVVEYRYMPGTTLLATIRSGNAQIELEYDKSGRVERARSSSGKEVRYIYGTDGNLTAATSGSIKIEYKYDDKHQLALAAQNGRVLYRNEYDDDGRLVRRFDGQNGVIKEQKLEEIGNGGFRTVQTMSSVTVTSTYDSQLRPIQVQAGSRVASYSYYSNGHLKGVEFSNSERGRVTIQVSEDAHDVRLTDLRGTMWLMRYGENGQLSQVFINGTLYVGYEHDTKGRTTAVRYAKTSERYMYDDAGRVSQYALESNDALKRSETLSVTYDKWGELSSITGSEFGPITISREPGKRINIQVGGRSIQTLMNSEGRISEIVGPGGDSVRYAFDSEGMPAAITVRTEDQEARALIHRGRIEELVDMVGARTHFEYSAEGQLVAVIDPYGVTTRYSYEGNRLQAISLPSGGRIHYSIDLKKRLLQIDSSTLPVSSKDAPMHAERVNSNSEQP